MKTWIARSFMIVIQGLLILSVLPSSLGLTETLDQARASTPAMKSVPDSWYDNSFIQKGLVCEATLNLKQGFVDITPIGKDWRNFSIYHFQVGSVYSASPEQLHQIYGKTMQIVHEKGVCVVYNKSFVPDEVHPQ